MALAQNIDTTLTATGGQGDVRDYLALLKPRVMSLVVFSGLIGLIAAPGSIHPWMGFIAILCIAIGAGASGALNMWFDADIDAKMARTANRPVPAGAITPEEALGFGLTLSVGSVLALGLLVNVYAGAFLAFTIFFYAVVYTMWLKRWTPQNIVIGGAAGAFPPAVAWVAATGSLDWGAFALFMIIFMWTPPHFWALALFRQKDYAEAGVPMLPNVKGRTHTKWQIMIYAALCLPTVVLPSITGVAGLFYTVGALALTLKLVWHSWVLLRCAENSEAEDKASKKLFGYSISWLFGLLTLLLVEQVLGLPMFEAWV
jgi:heme o synthase